MHAFNERSTKVFLPIFISRRAHESVSLPATNIRTRTCLILTSTSSILPLIDEEAKKKKGGASNGTKGPRMHVFPSDLRRGHVYASSRQLSQRAREESHTYAAEPPSDGRGGKRHQDVSWKCWRGEGGGAKQAVDPTWWLEERKHGLYVTPSPAASAGMTVASSYS